MFNFSKNVEYKKLSEIVTIKNGSAKITKATATPGNIPVVGSGHTPAYYHNEANAMPKTITIGRQGNAGVVKMWDEAVYVLGTAFIVEPKDENLITKEFLYCFLKHKEKFLRKCGESALIMPTLKIEILNNLKVPLLPLNQQRKFLEYLGTLQQHNEQLQHLAKLKDQMWHAMINNLFNSLQTDKKDK